MLSSVKGDEFLVDKSFSDLDLQLTQVATQQADTEFSQTRFHPLSPEGVCDWKKQQQQEEATNEKDLSVVLRHLAHNGSLNIKDFRSHIEAKQEGWIFIAVVQYLSTVEDNVYKWDKLITAVASALLLRKENKWNNPTDQIEAAKKYYSSHYKNNAEMLLAMTDIYQREGVWPDLRFLQEFRSQSKSSGKILTIRRIRERKTKDGDKIQGMKWKSFFSRVAKQHNVFEEAVFIKYKEMMTEIMKGNAVDFFDPQEKKFLFYSSKFAEDFVSSFVSGNFHQVIYSNGHSNDGKSELNENSENDNEDESRSGLSLRNNNNDNLEEGKENDKQNSFNNFEYEELKKLKTYSGHFISNRGPSGLLCGINNTDQNENNIDDDSGHIDDKEEKDENEKEIQKELFQQGLLQPLRYSYNDDHKKKESITDDSVGRNSSNYMFQNEILIEQHDDGAKYKKDNDKVDDDTTKEVEEDEDEKILNNNKSSNKYQRVELKGRHNDVKVKAKENEKEEDAGSFIENLKILIQNNNNKGFFSQSSHEAQDKRKDSDKNNYHLYIWATIWDCGNIIKIGFTKSSLEQHLSLIKRSTILEKYCYIKIPSLSQSSLKELESNILDVLKKEKLHFQSEYYTHYKRPDRSEIFQRFKSNPITFPITFKTPEEMMKAIRGDDRWDLVDKIVKEQICIFLKNDSFQSLMEKEHVQMSYFDNPEIIHKINHNKKQDMICNNDENDDIENNDENIEDIDDVNNMDEDINDINNSDVESWHSIHKHAMESKNNETWSRDQVTKKNETWSRDQVTEAVSKFITFDYEVPKILILGIDHIDNCSTLIIRIFATHPKSFITIIEREEEKIDKLQLTLFKKISYIKNVLLQDNRLVFKNICVIKDDLSKQQLNSYSHMYVLSSGLSEMFYFKVVLIIISCKIKSVCGYLRGIENVVKYLPGSIVTSCLASLGRHIIPIVGKCSRTKSIGKDDFFLSQEKEINEADNEKYFTTFRSTNDNLTDEQCLKLEKDFFKILNEEFNKKIIPFMNCPQKNKKDFDFFFFGQQGYIPVRFTRSKKHLEKQVVFSSKKEYWLSFWLGIANNLKELSGLKEVVQIDSDLITETITSHLSERDKNRDADNHEDLLPECDLIRSDEEDILLEIVSPDYFKGTLQGIKSVISDIAESITDLNVGNNSTSILSLQNREEYCSTTNSCRFDSVMSILFFLYNNYFSSDDIKELELYLPTFSILFQLLKTGKVSIEKARAIWYCILSNNQTKGLHGPIQDVYRSIKMLMMGSIKDPPTMSLFTTPYFCSPWKKCQNNDCEKNYEKKKLIRKNNLEKVSHWGYGLNPIKSMYLSHSSNEQEYCLKGCGALCYVSVVDKFPKYCSIFCSRERANEIGSVTEVTFLNMHHRLISIAYANHVAGQENSTDHFLSIMRNNNNEYFICDGLTDIEKPKQLETSSFPIIYESLSYPESHNKFYPVMLVYERITNFNSLTSFYKDKDTNIMVETLINKTTNNNDGIKICLSESVPMEYIPDRFYLARTFINKHEKLISNVGFSGTVSNDGDTKRLSIFFSLAQVFFYNKILANIILKQDYSEVLELEEEEEELLQILKTALLSLRYTPSPLISYDSVGIKDFFAKSTFSHKTLADKILSAVHKIYRRFFSNDNELYVNCKHMTEGTICENCKELIKSTDKKRLILSIFNSVSENSIYLKERILVDSRTLELKGLVFKNNEAYHAYTKGPEGYWYNCKYDKIAERVQSIPNEILDITYLIYALCDDLHEKEIFITTENSFKAVKLRESEEYDKELKCILMSDVLPRFVNDSLRITDGICSHYSCKKSMVTEVNIVPEKYLKLLGIQDENKTVKLNFYCSVKTCGDAKRQYLIDTDDENDGKKNDKRKSRDDSDSDISEISIVEHIKAKKLKTKRLKTKRLHRNNNKNFEEKIKAGKEKEKKHIDNFAKNNKRKITCESSNDESEIVM